MATSCHTMDVYSTTNDVFWLLGVEPGEQNRLLVTWGHHVHDRATWCLIDEVAVHAVVGQQRITRVVEDDDSGEIFVLCSTVADARRLSDYSVDVSGDCIIFKTVHHLNLIGSPYDLNYLNKTKPIRWHWDFVCSRYCSLSYISSTSSSSSHDWLWSME